MECSGADPITVKHKIKFYNASSQLQFLFFVSFDPRALCILISHYITAQVRLIVCGLRLLNNTDDYVDGESCAVPVTASFLPAMSMPSSTANWHWKNKNVTRWAKEWFERELTTIKIEGEAEGESVSISEVKEVDGDVELGQRKSKSVHAPIFQENLSNDRFIDSLLFSIVKLIWNGRGSRAMGLK